MTSNAVRQLFAILLLLAAGEKALAGSDGQAVGNAYHQTIERALWEAQGLSGNADAGKAPAASSCEATYNPIYNKTGGDRSRRDTVDMQMFFGYMDSTDVHQDVVHDKYIAEELIAKMQQPCEPGLGNTCGFRQSPDDGELFLKDVTLNTGAVKHVQLRISHSSEHGSDRANRAGPEQVDRTARTKAQFLHALKTADVVIYGGHARAGGGPSFGPPDLRKSGPLKGTIDYDKYKREKPGLNEMVAALNSTSTPPKILGVFACNPDALFGDALEDASRSRSGLVLSGKYNYFSSMLYQALATLDSALNMRCENDMNKLVNSMPPPQNQSINPPSRVTLRGAFRSGGIPMSIAPPGPDEMQAQVPLQPPRTEPNLPFSEPPARTTGRTPQPKAPFELTAPIDDVNEPAARAGRR